MKKKILIVEDEKDLRQLYAETFPAFEVFQAKNGKEGYELALKHRPDIIISDIRMPEMTGVQMVAKLRTENVFCAVVFVTGYSETVNRDEAAQVGAFDFLEKPIKVARLRSAVKSALLLGKNSVASLTTGATLSTQKEKEFMDLVLPGIPTSVVRKVEAHCSLLEVNLEKTIIQWITERADNLGNISEKKEK